MNKTREAFSLFPNLANFARLKNKQDYDEKKEKNTIYKCKINKKSKKCTKILQNKKSFCSDLQQNLSGQMEQCKDCAMTGRKRRYTL